MTPLAAVRAPTDATFSVCRVHGEHTDVATVVVPVWVNAANDDRNARVPVVHLRATGHTSGLADPRHEDAVPARGRRNAPTRTVQHSCGHSLRK